MDGIVYHKAKLDMNAKLRIYTKADTSIYK